MIKRYVYGKPIETGAILKKPEIDQGDPGVLTREGNVLSCQLQPEDIVYGLGEHVRGINKRGWIYVSRCTDDPDHLETKASLYGAHNFLLISGQKNVGLFIDFPGKITFDVGYTKLDQLKITVEEENYELYQITGEHPADVVKEFRTLIGQSYLPPRWAFGNAQSRWGYQTEEDIREVARNYRENHIPLDMINLDIDYMERYKDFTIDRERFPHFEQLVSDMKDQGIHLIPIIDTGIRIEPGYDVYEEGREKGYFCKDQEGKDYTVGVWPGRCHFPDVLNEEAGQWFGEKYRRLVDKGIDGFWNDMNEPAIFYSQKHLQEVLDEIATYKQENLDVYSYFHFQDIVKTLANNEGDYRDFYHNYRGQKVRHDKVHNLFGYYMTKAAADAFEQMEPDKRILLYSRASYIGMHRLSGIWMGDNRSWWSHLLLSLKMLPSLNMCGFLYTGADLGGFGSDTTEDLLLRWLALGIFMPLMRNHSTADSRRQEPYIFGDPSAERDIIRLRYRLIPYLYSEFMKAALTNTMYASPLGFVWEEDPIARRTEDQLMIGESIMIAPVYEQNAVGRVVYLPEEMKLIRFGKDAQVTEERVLPKGHHYIEIPLDQVVLFLRKGHILPLAHGGENTEEIPTDQLTLISFDQTKAEYDLYEDDGLSRKVSLAGHLRHITV